MIALYLDLLALSLSLAKRILKQDKRNQAVPPYSPALAVRRQSPRARSKQEIWSGILLPIAERLPKTPRFSPSVNRILSGRYP